LETELEAMVVKLLGDGTVYEQMMKDAEAITVKATASITAEATRLEQTFAKQAATFGMSGRQAELYKLQLAGATQQELAQAQAMDTLLTAQESAARAQQQGAQITRSVRDRHEEYRAKVAELDQLLAKGAITQQTYNRAVHEAASHIHTAKDAAVDLMHALQGGIAALAGQGALTQAYHAYADLEFVVTGLTASIKAQGGAVEDTIEQHKRFADEMEKVANVDDDITMGLLAKAHASGLEGEAAERAAKNAIALASLKMGGAEHAMSAIRQTIALEQGHVEMLARQFRQLKDIHDPMEKMEKMQELLNQGMEKASAEHETHKGKLIQLKNEWGQMLKAFGEVVAVVAGPLVEGLKDVVTWVKELPYGVKAVIVSVVALTTALAATVAAIAVFKAAGIGGAFTTLGMAFAGGGRSIWSGVRAARLASVGTEAAETLIDASATNVNTAAVNANTTAVSANAAAKTAGAGAAVINTTATAASGVAAGAAAVPVGILAGAWNFYTMSIGSAAVATGATTAAVVTLSEAIRGAIISVTGLVARIIAFAAPVAVIAGLAYAVYSIADSFTGGSEAGATFNAQLERSAALTAQLTAAGNRLQNQRMGEIGEIEDPETRADALREEAGRLRQEIEGAANNLRGQQAQVDAAAPSILSLWQSGRAVWQSMQDNVRQNTAALEENRRRLQQVQEEYDKASRLAGKYAEGEIDKTMQKISLGVETVGMSADEKRLHELRTKFRATDTQLAPLQMEMIRLGNAKDLEKLNDELTKLTHGFNEHAKVVGLTALETKLYDAAARDIMNTRIAAARVAGKTENELKEIRAAGLTEEEKALAAEKARSGQGEMAVLRAAGLRAEMFKMNEEMDKTIKKTNDHAASLEFQAANMTATSGDIKVFEENLKRARDNLTAMTEAQERQLRAAVLREETAKLAIELNKVTLSLQDQIATAEFHRANLNATKTDLKLFEIQLKAAREGVVGLSTAQIAAARAAGDYAEMIDLANKLTEKYELPADKYAREAQKIADAFASGAIDERVWGRAMQDAQKLLEDGKNSAQGFQAALVGSSEAMFRLSEYRDRMRGPLIDVTGRNIARPENIPRVPANMPVIDDWPSVASETADVLVQGAENFAETMRLAMEETRRAAEALAERLRNGEALVGGGDWQVLEEELGFAGGGNWNQDVMIHFTPDLGEVLNRIGQMANDLSHSIPIHFVPDLPEVNAALAALCAEPEVLRLQPELRASGAAGRATGADRDPVWDTIATHLAAIKESTRQSAEKELVVEFEGANLT
jgi:hypothetical protein